MKPEGFDLTTHSSPFPRWFAETTGQSAKRLILITPKWGKFAASGTDVMILEKNFADKFNQNIGVFAQATVSFCKNCDRNIFFVKNAIFSPKIGKNSRKLHMIITSTPGHPGSHSCWKQPPIF
jgi:hypothetical protein